jgi:hypothetical protein
MDLGASGALARQWRTRRRGGELSRAPRLAGGPRPARSPSATIPADHHATAPTRRREGSIQAILKTRRDLRQGRVSALSGEVSTRNQPRSRCGGQSSHWCSMRRSGSVGGHERELDGGAEEAAARVEHGTGSALRQRTTVAHGILVEPTPWPSGWRALSAETPGDSGLPYRPHHQKGRDNEPAPLRRLSTRSRWFRTGLPCRQTERTPAYRPILCVAAGCADRRADGARSHERARHLTISSTSTTPRAHHAPRRRLPRRAGRARRIEASITAPACAVPRARLSAGAGRRLGGLVPLGLEIPNMRSELSRMRPCPPALDNEWNAGNDETGSERAQDEPSERDALEIPD